MKGIKYGLLLVFLMICAKLQAQGNETIYPSIRNDDIVSELQLLDLEINEYGKKADKFGGIAVAGIVGVSLSLFSLNDGGSSNALHLGLASVMITCVSGVGGLNNLDKKKRKQSEKRALLESQKIGYMQEQPEIYIGMTNHGVGIGIRF